LIRGPNGLATRLLCLQTRNYKLDLTLGGTVDAVKGPAGSVAIVPGLNWGTSQAEQISGKKLPFQRIPLKTEKKSLVWEKMLELCLEGARYPPKGGKRMPRMPDYSTGNGYFEVQGVWSIPEHVTSNLRVRVGVQQILAYAAMVPNWCGLCPRFKVYQDKEGRDELSIDIPTTNLEKISDKAELPFTS
jgi:hypothetical protein